MQLKQMVLLVLVAFASILVLVTHAYAQAVPANCTPDAIRSAALSVSGEGGGELDLSKCRTTPIGPLNLTGLTSVSIDFGKSTVQAKGFSVGVDLTGSYHVELHHGHVFGASQVDVLAGLDSKHCQLREQGNLVFDDMNVDSRNLPNSVAYAIEGAEQVTWMNDTWTEGDAAALDVYGDGAGTVPYKSPYVVGCPTGQSDLIGVIIQATFVGHNGRPAIRIHGRVSEWSGFGLYMTTDGPAAGAHAVEFLNGPAWNFRFLGTRIEGFARAFTGRCIACDFDSNPPGQEWWTGSTSTVTATPAPTPTMTRAPTATVTPQAATPTTRRRL